MFLTQMILNNFPVSNAITKWTLCFSFIALVFQFNVLVQTAPCQERLFTDITLVVACIEVTSLMREQMVLMSIAVRTKNAAKEIIAVCSFMNNQFRV